MIRWLANQASKDRGPCSTPLNSDMSGKQLHECPCNQRRKPTPNHPPVRKKALPGSHWPADKAQFVQVVVVACAFAGYKDRLCWEARRMNCRLLDQRQMRSHPSSDRLISLARFQAVQQRVHDWVRHGAPCLLDAISRQCITYQWDETVMLTLRVPFPVS